MQRIKDFSNLRAGFFTLAVVLFSLKTYVAYNLEFSLGVEGFFQELILFINPLALTILFFSIALYFKNSKTSYSTLFMIYFLLSLLLYANILYYREFSDFLTINIVGNAGSVNTGLIQATLALLRGHDFIYWIDFIALVWLIKSGRVSMGDNNFPKRKALTATAVGLGVFILNLTAAEIDRPQLLTRTFDRNYIVKYLGLNFFSLYDGHQTIANSQVRASADESDVTEVLDYVDNNQTQPNPEMFGLAEDRNVFYFELESIQQFLIDYELKDENGNLHEVMPFLNEIYHSPATHSFNNFFHQTGQGKTSDAEMLAENSLFGLPQGGAFTQLGSENTFHSFSKILESEQDYTTSVFHGNVGSFWNRTDTYNSFGIDYFFDSSYYDLSGQRAMEYGLKDKLLYHDSVKYLEQLPQPFFAKFLPSTHHFPYPLDEASADFPEAQTDDRTINQYFVTAHYADEAIGEFFAYLKDSGLYEDSIFVLYGDHYGVSDSRNDSLAPLLGKDSEEWNNYDNAMMQRVPLMIHIPGTTNGQVHDTYSGQVDIMPTVLRLLGINTEDYVLMGQDLFSKDYQEGVVFRNGDIITPEITLLNGQNVYVTETGEEISDQLTDEELEKITQMQDAAVDKLSLSDNVLMKDLLRFYTPPKLHDQEGENEYLYSKQLDILVKEPHRDSSLYAQNNGETTAHLYETNAPEVNGGPNQPTPGTQVETTP